MTPWQLWGVGVQPVYCTFKSYIDDKGKRREDWTPLVATTGGLQAAPFAFQPPPAEPFELYFRPPLHAFVMDVDDHDGRGTGPATIAAMEADLGPLPPTCRITSRGAADPTGKRLYRIPDDLIVQNQPFKAYGGAIDSIRTEWRFARAPGQVHRRTGQPEVCYNPDNRPVTMPHVDAWPELPDPWVEYLRSFKPSKTTDNGEGSVRKLTRAYADRLRAKAWEDYYATPGDVGQGAREMLLKAARVQRQHDQLTGETTDIEALVRKHADYNGGELGPSARKALEDGVAYARVHRWELGTNEPQWMLDLARTPEPTPANGHPPVTKGRPRLDVTNAAVMADWLRGQLGTGLLSGMFARGSLIVHTPREGEDGYIPLSDDVDSDDGPAQVRPVTPDYIAARVQYTYACFKKVKTKEGFKDVPSLFPVPAARTAVNAVDMLPNLRRLRGVVHTPVLRADGSILSAPGYDPATKLLHLPEPGLIVPPVPDTPTPADVEAANTLVDEMIGEFPFVTEHDRANYIGLLLTPLLRNIAPPPYKLGAIGAHQPGSGKTLLANIIRYTHGGVFRAEMPEDDAELRKQISTILDVTTGPVVVLDNVSGVLRSSVLSGMLSSNLWEDRKLGGMKEMISRPNDRLWIVTGNNLHIAADLPRRTLRVAIDPKRPNPELRTHFKIDALEDWVRQRRGDLLHALLTLARAWAAAGMPLPSAQSSDGYSRWVQTVNGILAHAGVDGEFDHLSIRPEIGTDDDEWRDFIATAYKVFGDRSWTVKELLGKVELTTHVESNSYYKPKPIPLDALPGQLAEKIVKSRDAGALVIARSLGMWLKNRDGRWAGEYCARHFGDDGHGTKTWRVEKGTES